MSSIINIIELAHLGQSEHHEFRKDRCLGSCIIIIKAVNKMQMQ